MIKTHVETRTVKDTITDSVTCDLCGKEFIGADGEFDGGINWLDEAYHSEITRVCYVVKDHYPDDYSESGKIDIHLCPDCFKGRLVPWLQIQGRNL
jgi:hypothetical protein